MASSLEQVGGNYGQIIRDFLAVAHADDGSLRNAGSTTLSNVLAAGNDAGGQKITNLLNPTNPTDAATKAYADAIVAVAQALSAVLSVGNDAGTLRIINLGDPVGAQDAATRHYVDNAALAQALSAVLTVGNSAGGLKIANLGTPTLSGDAVTKAYVDARNLAAVLAAGSDAGGTRITNLGAPSVTTDAATKAYVDALTRTLAQVLAAGADAAAGQITNLGAPVNQTDAATKGYVDAVTFNTQTTAYTVVLSDAGKTVVMSAASGLSLTLPLNATVAFPNGTTIFVRQGGAGQVTIGGPGAGAGGGTAGGVTVNNPYTSFVTFGQNAEVKLLKTGTNAWSVNGDVA